MPLSAPVSTSAQLADVRMLFAVVPEDGVSSSVPVSTTGTALLIVGASLAPLIVMATVAVAVAPPASATV